MNTRERCIEAMAQTLWTAAVEAVEPWSTVDEADRGDARSVALMVLDALLALRDEHGERVVSLREEWELAGYDDPDLPGEYWPPAEKAGGWQVLGKEALYRFVVQDGGTR